MYNVGLEGPQKIFHLAAPREAVDAGKETVHFSPEAFARLLAAASQHFDLMAGFSAIGNHAVYNGLFTAVASIVVVYYQYLHLASRL